jgi:RimJ/RimL family protein N-acetyltransferase
MNSNELAWQKSGLIFRKIDREDFGRYLELVGNYEVMKLITGKALSKNQALKRFREIILTNKRYFEIGYYFISLRDTKQFIGLGKIVLKKGNEAEIGYSLLPGFWRKGYGSAISEKLINHSRKVPFIKRLTAIIDPENGASKRILIKSGFVLDKVCKIGNLPAEIYRLDLE